MTDGAQIRWNGWGGPGEILPEPAWRWLARAMAMPALLATPPRELEDIALPGSRLAESAREKFAALLGADGVRQDKAARARHAAGRGYGDLLRLRGGDLSRSPDAVLYPRKEQDVLAILRLCAEMGIAVVPFGGGTGMVGGVTPARGRHGAVVTLAMSGMARVNCVDAVSGLAQAEAGIAGPELARQLAARGMMLGHRPSSFEFSTLGGWIAQNDVGQEAARYGRAADWLQGVRVATPRGLIEAADTAAGPDLKQVMLGSDGAFGVITAARIRIRAMPMAEEQRGYLFPDFASGIAAIREAVRAGLPHALLRLSDDGESQFDRAMNRQGRTLHQLFFDVYREIRRFDHHAAALVAGFAGSEGEIAAARKTFDGLARRLGALPLGVDTRWRAQRHGFGARRDALLDRGVGIDSLRTAATWAELPSLYVGVRAALMRAMREHTPRDGAQGLVLAHVGPAWRDGASLGFTWIFPRRLEGDIAQGEAIKRAALEAVARRGGTVSHGEGVGEERLPWMAREKGELGLETLRSIKRSLDPEGTLNPGKLIA